MIVLNSLNFYCVRRYTMKKITIIFIIVICLLSFLGDSCLAESSDSETWNLLNSFDKGVYVKGIWAGAWMFAEQIKECRPTQFANSESGVKFMALYKDFLDFTNFLFPIESDHKLNVKKSAKRWKSLVKTINYLYKDPANSYIPVRKMCFVAARKLKGEPIESLLRELRKEAL